MKILILLATLFPMILTGQSISATYSTGDIPTSLGSYDPSCNGPLTTISITLPTGGPWIVTGIDISYNITAGGLGLMSHQRSQIHCQNSNTTEASVYQGTGNTGGTQAYDRTGVDIAAGTYEGNTTLVFEMRAWRTSIGFICSTAQNKVDNLTWTITLHYTTVPSTANVGIGTLTPEASALLELNSNQKGFLMPRMTTVLRDAIPTPAEGLMVFCTDASPPGVFTYIGSVWQHTSGSSLEDEDGDTYIRLEQAPDEDKVRISTAGLERLTIAHNGKIGIGTVDPDYPLDIHGNGARILNIENSADLPGNTTAIHIEHGGSNSGNKYGITNIMSTTNNSSHIGFLNQQSGGGTGAHIGLLNDFAETGSGPKYGVFNNILSSSTIENSGITSQIESYGTGTCYGTQSILFGEGNGQQIGSYHFISNSSEANHIGTLSEIVGNGPGIHYGTYNILGGAGSGAQYGSLNAITNSGQEAHYGIQNLLQGHGNGMHTGSYNEVSGSGSGIHSGSYNIISNNGNGDHFGSINLVFGNGNGTQYGSKIEVTTTGTGIKYGLYSDVSFSTGTKYAGYFNGDVTVLGTFNNPCDEKLKTDISQLGRGSSLAMLQKVKIYQYNFDQDQYPFMDLPSTLQTGVLAQEMQEVFPELVKTNIHPAFVPDREEDSRQATPEVEYLGVNYIGLIPHLVSGVQDLAGLHTTLTDQIAGQNAIILSLQQQLDDNRNTIESLRVKQDQMALQLETLIKLIENK